LIPRRRLGLSGALLHHLLQAARFESFNKFGRASEKEDPMRHHDPVADGFLALTAAGLVLLCSSLLAFVFVA
jgi:hypothetical protein